MHDTNDTNTVQPKHITTGGFNDAVKYHLTGMYQDWFLDYASYVILERAVPDLYDGLKPVQRRILHAMKCVDDGRYNKVANIVGQTMQYHPHGDQSIGDALVQLGQKDLLIDCQGNWGNILTGDGAAAPRYIEARLSKFALETVFNSKTTHWMLSYDGRKKEPINLPVKFPLLLAQGVEGIAVGLNSKILPHNFNELCDAALAYLRGESFQLFPDFSTGGTVDVSRYNDGERGGVIKIRSRITKSADNKTLIITEIPYGTTSTGIIETILKANQKGKIKIRKVDDNTAQNAEIVVQLQPGSSSDKTIDALYACTDCEVSISPNCCVIQDKKPIFTNVSELLRQSVKHTTELLQWELAIQKAELEEQYFYTSLEKIFIEQRIYKEKQFEDSTSAAIAIRFIDKALEPFKPQFIREVRKEDIQKLLEIKMMRITKFDSKKADELMKVLDDKIKDTNNKLAHLTDYTIQWFEGLKQKYGVRYPRRTEVRNFANINIKTVVEANEKLYINRQDGFIGTGLKKDEFLFMCSDIDDIIIFYKDGKYKITRVAEKIFIGTNIQYIAVFKKQDERTIYNVVYRDGKGGVYYMKRFAVTGLARDKEYDLTQGKPGSKIVYFTANPNGEAEIIRVQLKPALHLKKMEVLKDLSELAVKGRNSRGNLLTKFEIQKVTLKQKGGSTLGGRKVWFDPDVLRINYDGQGNYLGEFQSDDQILVIARNGEYYTTSFDLTAHFEDNILRIEKYDADKIWSAALWDGEQKYYYAKRFQLETTGKPQNFLGEHPDSRLVLLSDRTDATFLVRLADETKEAQTVCMEEFISVKSARAKGKRLTTQEVAAIEDITPELVLETEDMQETETIESENSAESTDIEMTINASIPEDSLPMEDETDAEQLSLF
ncbi:MAG: DNA gyrase/topoisomerase IV subunit A [Paludibacter sp.]|nr:DNA gyrase/topoisomerase IV subunit A [Bacteroidales bacterium]MCM1069988.1 DNA gyrase/topoisomerase IV subunit A [Prevotella sp.]MCM1354734.1 DNA gyrase/topoisomerase IV subunit A [Bacteroides sp.]MCM1443592.1 DNA gyrase/topoisomerase IV subunit A [Muribaculum sp.]MCM1482667.1 DNA gyrase/topoisomerase IV subunit A [Paludibacter sp.]